MTLQLDFKWSDDYQALIFKHTKKVTITVDVVFLPRKEINK